jgi:hypothetical protein
VDQHDGRSAAGDAIDHSMTVQFDLPLIELALGRAYGLETTILCPRRLALGQVITGSAR